MPREEPLSLSLQLEEERASSLTEGYDEYFDPPLPNVYECPVCLLVLRCAVQTECGHRFCKGCILKTIREGRKVCPVDNQALTEDEIYPDNFARREILAATVCCRNSKSTGCTWRGKLADIENHMLECLYELVECENGCGMQIQKKDVEEHMQNACPRRLVECQYCQMSIVQEKLNDHYTRCQKYPVMCPNLCSSTTLLREEVDSHIENDCPKAKMACPYTGIGCDFEDIREAVAEHLRTSSVKHTADLVEIVRRVANETEEKSRIIADINVSKDEEVIMKLVNLERQNSRLQEKVNKLEESVTQAHTLIEYLTLNSRQNIGKVEEQVAAVSKRIDEHDIVIKEVQAKLWCGRFIWRINNFEGLFQEAKSGGIPAIHSLPFYTSLPGYKMCIRVNLNGVDTGAGSHTSVFIHMMQGEFDSILPWPFLGKITLKILDQSEGEKQDVTESLVAKPDLQAFVKPRTVRNHKGYGYVQMISHETLRNGRYVKNDTLLVEVKVEV